MFRGEMKIHLPAGSTNQQTEDIYVHENKKKKDHHQSRDMNA